MNSDGLMKIDNTDYYLRMSGRVLLILGALMVSFSIISWQFLDLFLQSDWWYHWDNEERHLHISLLKNLFYFYPVFCLLGGLLFLVSGIGLSRGSRWALHVSWIPAVILLFEFPIGTALGIALIYLLQRKKRILTGQPVQ